MKLLYILLFFPLFAMAQTKPVQGFSVAGTIKGLAENEVVTFTDVNNPDDTLARTLVKKGVFVLKGTIKEPNMYNLNFHGSQKKMMLFMGNDIVTVTGDATSLQAAVVKGSPLHNEFKEFQDLFNPLFQKLAEMNQTIGGQTDLKRDDTLMVAYTAHLEKVKHSVDSFVIAKKASPIGPFTVLVTSELEQDVVVLERRFNTLDVSQKNGFFGKLLKTQIDEAKFGSIGSDAIPFAQNDTTGKPVFLANFKGKYVLIDFWASWCRPCRMENPNVVEAYNKFKNKNFTVLGISLDRSREDWIKAIKDDRLTWTHVSDLKFWNNEVAQKYHVQSIPQNYLIGPDGKIVGKNLRGAELQMKLCELLGCN